MDQAGFSPETLLAQRAWVKALARSLVKDEADSDDLEQQAWLAALRAAPSAVRHPRAWLATILRREVSAERRREDRRSRREESAARSDRVRATADVVADAEIHRAVVDAVLALDEPYRSTVLLRYFESLPPREVARRQGVPVETVRARTRRGLALLRGRLAPLALAIAALAGLSSGTVAAGVAMTTSQKVLICAALLLAAGIAFVAWSWQDGRTASGRASAPGGAEAMAPDPPPPLAQPTPPDESAAEGCPVRVVGADRVGLAGARIVAVHEARTESAQADATGVARFTEALAGPVVLWASAPGYALRRFERSLSKAETRVVLDRGGRVRLVFEDANGAPIDGAEARRRYGEAGLDRRLQVLPQEVFDWWDQPAHAGLPVPEDAWRTGADFEWSAAGAEVAPLAAGRWRVFVARPGVTDRLTDVFAVRDGETTTVRVALPAPETRRVRLVREDNGQPFPGARARALFAAHWTEMATLAGVTLVADERGEVDLPLTPRRDYGFSWQFEADGWSGAFAGDLRKAKAVPIEMRLWPRWEARGTAFLASGEPAAAAEILCRERGRHLLARTDEAGHFQFGGLGRGSGGRLETTFLLVESRDPPVVSRVEMHGDPWWFTPARPRLQALRQAAGEAEREARRDRGNAALAERYRDLLRESQEAEAEARRTSPTSLDIRIGAPAGGGSVRVEGRITTGGAPLPDADVSVSTEFGTRRTVTDGSGAFALGQVGGKSCEVYVTWGHVSEFGRSTVLRGTLELPGGGVRRLDIDLPAGEVVLNVVDADTGQAIPRARVSAGPADEEAHVKRFEGLYYLSGWNAITDETGTALLRCLVQGEPSVIAVAADGYEEGRLPEVVPGSATSPAQASLRLKPRP